MAAGWKLQAPYWMSTQYYGWQRANLRLLGFFYGSCLSTALARLYTCDVSHLNS